MAFVKRGETGKEKPVETKPIIKEFDSFREQAEYAIKYLKTEYGIDIYEEGRKPAMYINLPNNPNYVGSIGTEKVQELKDNTNDKLLEFLNSQK